MAMAAMTRMTVSIWPQMCAALLMLSIFQSVHVMALSISHSNFAVANHCSAFTSCRRSRHMQSNVPRNHVVVGKASMQLAAAEDDDGNFFSDGSSSSSGGGGGGGGSFFDEVEKPPPNQQKEEEHPMTLEELEMMATPFDEHLPKINTVTLVGRVGNAPEPKYFDDGKVVLNLSLAVKRKYHPLERKVREIRSGEEETDWFPLEIWGRDAEYVTNYVEKGARIGITGSLVVDGWADKMTGEQRRKPKVLVRHIDILETRAEADLRKSNKGSYGGDGNSGGSRRKYDDDGDDGGPSPAGTGGFFS